MFLRTALSLGGIWYLLYLFALVAAVCSVVTDWILFKRAGHPGWAALIPYYSDYIAHQMYWGNGWLFLVPTAVSLLQRACGQNSVRYWVLELLVFVWIIFNGLKKAAAFGRSRAFGWGLAFLDSFFSVAIVARNDPYLGVPRDGWSWEEIKAKLQSR